jgi:hypothetical protein
MGNRDHDICPLEYPGFLEDRYFIEGTVIPRCWHSFDDAILPWIPSSGVGLVVGAERIPWESSDESPNKRPTRS